MTWPAAPAAGASSTRPPGAWSGMPATPWSGSPPRWACIRRAGRRTRAPSRRTSRWHTIDGRRYAFVGRGARQLRRRLRPEQSALAQVPPGAAGDQRPRGSAGDSPARAVRGVQRSRRPRGQCPVHDRHLPARPRGKPEFPTIKSAAPGGVPIGWGALSGLSADPRRPDRLWSVSDSYYAPTQLFSIKTSHPHGRRGARALITSALTVTENGTPLAVDGEGIAARRSGGFWLATEGGAPATGLKNELLLLDPNAAVQRRVSLPAEVSAGLATRGLEGIAVTGSGDERTGLRGPAKSADRRSGRGRADRPLPGGHRNLGLVRLPAGRRLDGRAVRDRRPGRKPIRARRAGQPGQVRRRRSSGSTPSIWTRRPGRAGSRC